MTRGEYRGTTFGEGRRTGLGQAIPRAKGLRFKGSGPWGQLCPLGMLCHFLAAPELSGRFPEVEMGSTFPSARPHSFLQSVPQPLLS